MISKISSRVGATRIFVVRPGGGSTPTPTPTSTITPTPTSTPTETPTPTPTIFIPENDLVYILIPNDDLTYTLIPSNDLIGTFIPDSDLLYTLIPNGDLNYVLLPDNDVNYTLIPNTDLTYTLIPNNDIEYSVLKPPTVFYGEIKLGEDSVEGTCNCSVGECPRFYVTGDGPTFCESNIFVINGGGTFFSGWGTIVHNGYYKTVNMDGTNIATYRTDCGTCPITPTPTPTPTPTYYYYYLLNCNLGDNKYGRSITSSLNGNIFNVGTNTCYTIVGDDPGPNYDYDLDIATLVTDCTDVLCVLPTPTPTSTSTPTPTPTPTQVCDTFTFNNVDATTTYNSATGGPNGGWTSSAYSTETYSNPVSVTFQTSANGNYLMGGFSYNPTANSDTYTNTTYGLYTQNDFLEIYENGGQATVPGGMVTLSTDIWKVEYDGTNVKYYKNGSLIHTSSNPVTQPLHIFFALLTPNEGVTNVCVIGTPDLLPTETPTPTPTATSTPTATPEMATLTIIVPPGTPSIIFDGDTYTSTVTAGVVKNQQYTINSSDGTSNFWYWSGTGINLPASNSQNTIVFVTGNTATLEVNYLNQPTPTPTATSTPTPTPTQSPLDFTISSDCVNGGAVYTNNHIGGSGVYDRGTGLYDTELEALNETGWFQIMTPSHYVSNGVPYFNTTRTYWVALRDRNNQSNIVVKSVFVDCG